MVKLPLEGQGHPVPCPVSCVKITPMKVLLVLILVGLLLLRISNSNDGISVADTSIPDNEVISRDANNTSATATITITMTGVLNE